MNNPLNVIILAAGKGKRMRSELPKVLQPLANKPLLQHCYETARELDSATIQIVFGHGGEVVRERMSHFEAAWVEQKQQLGTGHAVQQAVPNIGDDDTVLVLYGDVPLLTVDTLQSLVAEVNDSTLALLTVKLDDPQGYGRIVRNEHGRVLRIVEQKDASDAEQKINEVNTGILAVKGARLKHWLSQLQSNNAQGEYYLTDIIAMAVADHVTVATQSPTSAVEVIGVNDKRQLAELERIYQSQWADRLMDDGVTLMDPARIDVRGKVSVGMDVTLDVNVVMEGEVVLGNRVTVGPNCVLRDVKVGDDVEIRAHCHLESASIGNRCLIGPYARVRPGTQLADEVHLGNFVELKNAEVDTGSKINHLSYIGDSSVGKKVNIGAGTITCNYDGAYKHKTVIEDDVFVGSDTQLVAPVTIRKGTTIGAGSTITKDTPADKLSLSRVKQVSVDGWVRPKKP